MRNPGAADAAAPGDIGHYMTRHDRDAGVGHLACHVAAPPCAAVDDHDAGAGAVQVERRAVGRVVVREDHRALAGADRVAVDVAGHGGCEHDPGPVVVAEHEWTLASALRQHGLPGAHAPQPLPHRVMLPFRKVLAAAFGQAQEVVIEIAEYRRARQHDHVIESGKLLDELLEPFASGQFVDQRLRRQQGAAELVLLVRDDDARTGPGRGQRRGQSGGTGAGDQHIAVCVAMLVEVGIRFTGRAAESGHATNGGLVMLPEVARIHEGLVIETRAEQAAQPIVDCTDIKVDARPAFGGPGPQARIQLDLGRARIRQRRSALADLHDGVRLLGAAAHDPPGPMQLEAAIDNRHVVRQ